MRWRVRMPQNSKPYRWADTLANMATRVPATAMGSEPAGEAVSVPGGPSDEGEASVITWARATVTALRARTRMPRSWASPSSVARSTTRKTARLSSQ
jgi:hypothetical protein